ncbi:MAG: hypothetical protein RXR03_05340 [Thermocladium sp.]
MQEPISKIVEDIVRENPLYMMAISTGIVNLSALAKEILPLVKSATTRPIKLGTIIKALERLEGKSMTGMPNIIQLLNEAEIMVYSGIGETEIPISEATPDLITMAGRDIAIIISDGSRLKIISPLRTLAKLSSAPTMEYSLIRISLAERAPVGFVTTLIQLMRSNKISVKHVLRYDNDVFIIVDRQDATRLMDMLERLRKQEQAREATRNP